MMRRTLRKPSNSLMHCSIEQQDKSMTIFPKIAAAIVLFCVRKCTIKNPASRWRGFVWRGSFTSLMVLRKTFLRDCSRFGMDSIVGGGRPFHQPAVAPVGEPRFYARWRFFHAEPPGQRLRPSRRLLPSRAPALAEALRVPDDNAAADGKHPSGEASSQREKYTSVYGSYRAASHRAISLVFDV